MKQAISAALIFCLGSISVAFAASSDQNSAMEKFCKGFAGTEFTANAIYDPASSASYKFNATFGNITQQDDTKVVYSAQMTFSAASGRGTYNASGQTVECLYGQGQKNALKFNVGNANLGDKTTWSNIALNIKVYNLTGKMLSGFIKFNDNGQQVTQKVSGYVTR